MKDLLYVLRALELLGEIRLGVMSQSNRRSDRWLYASLYSVEIVECGIATHPSVHGGSAEECVRDLFDSLVQVKAPAAIRCEYGLMRWDTEMGTWLRVEAVAA
jgi:hypothetical protein